MKQIKLSPKLIISFILLIGLILGIGIVLLRLSVTDFTPRYMFQKTGNFPLLPFIASSIGDYETPALYLLQGDTAIEILVFGGMTPNEVSCQISPDG